MDTKIRHVLRSDIMYWCGVVAIPGDMVVTAGYALSRLKSGEGGVCEGCLHDMARFIDQQVGSEAAMAYKQKPPTPRPEPMPGLAQHSEPSRVSKLAWQIVLVCLAVVCVLALLKGALLLIGAL